MFAGTTSENQIPSQSLADRFRAVRRASEALAAPLSPEDQTVQSMPDVSPTKWHLAHTTWFFETFLLQAFDPGYRTYDPAYGYLFNSYYEAVGERYPRPARGLVTRPGVAEIQAYRRHVTEAAARLIEHAGNGRCAEAEAVVELGIHHEQQHQELILMDIKHVLAQSPLLPAYRASLDEPASEAPPLAWVGFEGGLREIGHAGDGFAFDNEGPRHKVWLEPFELATRPVTAGEYLAFVEDGGYRQPMLWLSDGWAQVLAAGWIAPLYWQCRDGEWWIFTLSGARPLDPAEPVVHVSYYEAAAFAKWADARLPSEAEWEIAAETVPLEGHLADDGRYHPRAAAGRGGLEQMIGDVWEWTQSPYSPYPGFREPPGAIGEYNGKFMSGKFVLRGGAAVTPADHVRITYRNFFPPESRWAFSGFRLAKDLP